MATCKDCIHFEICSDFYDDTIECSKSCTHFKDRSRFVELPCKIGDIGYAFYARKSKYNANPKPIIKRGLITEMRFNRNMDLLVTVHRVATGIIGKTVFLTREEAEQGGEGA